MVKDKLLTVELIPKTAWGQNIRKIVSANDWNWVKKELSKHAGHVCQVCGGKGDKWPVEIHEKWYFDYKERTQTLNGLIALCPNCHKAKHIGLASINGEADFVVRHIMKVNDWSKLEAENHIQDKFSQWRKRNKYDWKLDVETVVNAIKRRDLKGLLTASRVNRIKQLKAF